MSDPRKILADEHSQLAAAIRSQTPARLFVDRRGTSYPTATWLGLRADHAAAADAVHTEIDLERDFQPAWVAQHQLFEVQSAATNKSEFLLRPDLGRQLSESARAKISERCQSDCGLQVMIGDGLSSAAISAQAPAVLNRLLELAQEGGWSCGQVFFVRYCRVGLMNPIGELLSPQVLVLLIGERPGLATSRSMSAYLAFRPREGQTDADRNLISNIHEQGVSTADAAVRIMRLAQQMVASGKSGMQVKEVLGSVGPAARLSSGEASA